jgi:hypothetical protein
MWELWDIFKLLFPLSDLWDIGLMGCRTCDVSDLWGDTLISGLTKCPVYGKLSFVHILGPIRSDVSRSRVHTHASVVQNDNYYAEPVPFSLGILIGMNILL